MSFFGFIGGSAIPGTLYSREPWVYITPALRWGKFGLAISTKCTVSGQVLWGSWHRWTARYRACCFKISPGLLLVAKQQVHAHSDLWTYLLQWDPQDGEAPVSSFRLVFSFRTHTAMTRVVTGHKPFYVHLMHMQIHVRIYIYLILESLKFNQTSIKSCYCYT